MTQGIFINRKRPRFKKEVREAVASNPGSVRIERTSWFPDEYDGPVSEAPDDVYYFVGPDPYTSRKFYGQVIVRDGKARVK